MAFIAAESQKKRLNDEVEKAIDEFWADDSVLELIEFHDGIAELARKIIRDGLPKGWKLKPLDAIHLATAKLIKATEFQTYDLSDCKRYESDLGIKICEPYVVQPKLI